MVDRGPVPEIPIRGREGLAALATGMDTLSLSI